jgi:hypothetical protein
MGLHGMAFRGVRGFRGMAFLVRSMAFLIRGMAFLKQL